jgi:uncharacterized protein YbjT (DUF2867 family)
VKVIIFGGTGMVGQGVLRECLLDPEVESVLVVGRTPIDRRHDKLGEIVHQDFSDFSSIADELSGYDACFFCLGVSAVGMKEEDYRRVTYDFTLAAATTLAERNPGMTFIYVSGGGTDSSERGRSMWARVKGSTENALLELPLKAYMFRPGFIQPLHGVTSKTRWYRIFYALTTPLYPALKVLFPKYVTNTEQLGRAMITVAGQGAPIRVLENRDINALQPMTTP